MKYFLNDLKSCEWISESSASSTIPANDTILEKKVYIFIVNSFIIQVVKKLKLWG